MKAAAASRRTPGYFKADEMKPPPLTWRDLAIAFVILALTLLGLVWPSHDQTNPTANHTRMESVPHAPGHAPKRQGRQGL